MAELKGMSQDMMKNSFDNATYDNEFRDLQVQLYDMTQQTFNGVTLFAQFTETRRERGVSRHSHHLVQELRQHHFDLRQFGRKFRSQGEPQQVAYAVRTDDQLVDSQFVDLRLWEQGQLGCRRNLPTPFSRSPRRTCREP